MINFILLSDSREVVRYILRIMCWTLFVVLPYFGKSSLITAVNHVSLERAETRVVLLIAEVSVREVGAWSQRVIIRVLWEVSSHGET